jgi:hypothetical protein
VTPTPIEASGATVGLAAGGGAVVMPPRLWVGGGQD